MEEKRRSSSENTAEEKEKSLQERIEEEKSLQERIEEEEEEERIKKNCERAGQMIDFCFNENENMEALEVAALEMTDAINAMRVKVRERVGKEIKDKNQAAQVVIGTMMLTVVTLLKYITQFEKGRDDLAVTLTRLLMDRYSAVDVVDSDDTEEETCDESQGTEKGEVTKEGEGTKKGKDTKEGEGTKEGKDTKEGEGTKEGKDTKKEKPQQRAKTHVRVEMTKDCGAGTDGQNVTQKAHRAPIPKTHEGE